MAGVCVGGKDLDIQGLELWTLVADLVWLYR